MKNRYTPYFLSFILSLSVSWSNLAFAQAPNISYNGTQTYTLNVPITPLTPANIGGPVPAIPYAQVSTFAGSGVRGAVNDTWINATFNAPLGLTTDASGNVYVADQGNQLIRKITPAEVVGPFAGSYNTGASNGAGISASFWNPAGLAADAVGNIYVADSYNNLIRKITPAGVVSTLAGATVHGNANGTGTSAYFYQPLGVATDASGNVYVADCLNNEIRKITSAGVVTTFAGSGVIGADNGTGTSATFNLPLSVATDAAGNVYVGDNGNYLVRKITPTGVVTTLAGSGVRGSADGTSTAASFYSTAGITLDALGNAYVADYGNNLIRKITPAGVVTTLAGGALGGSVDGIGSAANLDGPQGITVDAFGNMYVADYIGNKIRKISITGYTISPSLPSGLSFDAATGIISGIPRVSSSSTTYTITAYNSKGSSTTTVSIGVVVPSVILPPPPAISYINPATYTAGTTITPLTPVNSGSPVPATAYGQVTTIAGTAGVQGKANGIGPAASFYWPAQITADASGNLYVGDNFTSSIRKISPAGVVSTLAGSTQGYADGFGSAAKFFAFGGLSVDVAGNLYASDNDMIRLISPSGLVSTFAGEANVGGARDAIGINATFNGPSGSTIDNLGNIYVADSYNDLIRKITPLGVVSTYAGQVKVGGSVDGNVSSATFKPFGCAVDAQGNLFVADGNNNKVRKITPAGVVTTLAGSGAAGSKDGTGPAANFSQVSSITVDPIGNLYVSDQGNGTIRKITQAGVVTTIAGSPGVFGASDGIGSAASFKGATGITTDLTGNLYVADFVNSTIRKISISGYAIDKSLPTGLIFDPTTGTITGTPQIVSPVSNYTITAYNRGGSSSAIVKIGVSGTMGFDAIPAKTYGAADFSPASAATGTVTYTSSNTNVATVVSGKIHILNVGTTTITATSSGITLSQLLTVTPALLTITANNQNRAYGVANPPLTLSYTGFVNTDAAASLTTLPTLSTTATTSSSPGGYPITISGAIGSNYTINYIAGTLTILGGQTTIAAPAISYTNSQNYTLGTPITNLQSSNSGGAVPATVYTQVSTIAGIAMVQGFLDGPGATAKFNQPSGIVADAAGNLYIAEQANNRIRKITPAGIVSTFAGNGTTGATNGNGTAASFSFPTGMTIDPATGNLYVTDQGDGLIRKITPPGDVSIFASGFFGPHGICIDKLGNLYVADTYNDLVRKITPTGVVSTVAGIQGVQGFVNGDKSVATFMQVSGIATDAVGNIFVTDLNSIRKIAADGTVSTIAGNPVSGSNDGIGAAASFSGPQSLIVDQAGNIFVPDEGYSLIRKITPDGHVTTIVGTATNSGTTGPKDGIGGAAVLIQPVGITEDAAGNLYVTDETQIRKIVTTGYAIDAPLPNGLTFDGTTGTISGTPVTTSLSRIYNITGYNIGGSSTSSVNITVNNIAAPVISYTGPQVYTLNTTIAPLGPKNTGGAIPAATYGLVSTFAGSGTAGTTNGTGTAASFNTPTGVATDALGNIYIADYSNNVIRKVTPAGVVSTFAGSGAFASVDGTGTGASFKAPTGVTADVFGNIYVAEYAGNYIRKISPAGVVSTFAGSGIAGSSNGRGGLATFNLPYGITTDATGNVYVADQNNNMIRKITPNGIVTILAGTGAAGAENGPGVTATFNSPQGLTTDLQGNIYVADDLNSLIRKITPDGTVSTFAGNGTFGRTDGTSISANFSNPTGIATDAAGNIYVSDAGYSLIRKITPAGVVSTIGGNASNGLINAIGTAASFSTPLGIATDVMGNIYIADKGNNLVRKLGISGYSINPALTAGLNFDATTGTISGTPTVATTAKTYTISGYNTGGSSSSQVSLAVLTAQTITFAPLNAVVYGSGDLNPGATTNSALQITYTSSNSNVATIINGNIHIVAVGSTNITASQPGDPAFQAAAPVTQPLTITPAPLTVTAINQSKYYSDSNPVLTFSYAGFVNGDTEAILSGQPTISTTATTLSPTGSYPITVSGARAANYGITYVPGTLTINAAPAPNITAISASTAIAGNTITLTGTYLLGATSVTFGGVNAASFTVNSPSSINAVVGDGASGNIVVATPTGTGTFAGFNFVPVPSITAGGPTTILSDGSGVVLTAVPGTGFSYQWFNNGSAIGGATNASYTATQSGNYTVGISLNGLSQVSQPVVVTSIFALPANNFKLTVTGLSCDDNNDGTINIEAAQHLNYTATITGNGLNTPYIFTDSLLIGSLAAGNYSVCITVAGQSGYDNCYTLIVTQPQPLSVYSVINSSPNSVTLSLNGGTEYFIKLNGSSYKTTQNSITLPLQPGNNSLKVTTDKLCQGSYEKLLNASGDILVYPVPFQDVLYLNIGDAVVENVMVKIYDTGAGKMVYASQYTNQSGVLQFDVSSLSSGVYALHLILNKADHIFKIVKR